MQADLTFIAGGDEYELAASEIEQLVLSARRRLAAAHPFFYMETPECDVPSLPKP